MYMIVLENDGRSILNSRDLKKFGIFLSVTKNFNFLLRKTDFFSLNTHSSISTII